MTLSNDFSRPVVIHSLGAVLCACLIGIVGYFIARPLAESRKTSTNEAIRLERLVHTNRQMYAELDALRQEFSIAEERANAIRRRIPTNREEAEMLENLSQLAKETRVTIKDYRRGEMTQNERFARMQVQLQCLGSFASICEFLSAINDLQRLTTIDSLQITTAEDPNRYPVNLTIALYQRLTNGQLSDASLQRLPTTEGAL